MKNVFLKLNILLLLIVASVTNVWADYAYLDPTGTTWWYNDGAAFRLDKNGSGNVDEYTEIGNTGVWRFNVGTYTGAATFKRMNSDRTTQWNYANVTINSSQNVFHTENNNGVTARTSFVIDYIHGTNHVYFDNSVSNFPNNLYFVIGHDYSPTGGSSLYTKTYKMSQLSGTSLWYVKVTDTWEDATYLAVIADDASSISAGSWGSSSLGSTNKGDKGYTAAYKTEYNMEGGTFLLKTSASGNKQAMTITYFDGYNNIPTNTMTISVRTKVAGGSYGSSYDSPTSVFMQARQLTDNGTVSAGASQKATVSTSAKSANIADVTTGKVEFSYTALAADAAWQFDGWGTSNSTVASTASTYSIDAGSAASKTATTRYAFFTRKPVLTVNKGTNGKSASGTASNNAKTSWNITATANTGYHFNGWTTSSGSVTYGDASLASTTATIAADATITATFAANTYTVTIDKQTSAPGYGGSAGSIGNQSVTYKATTPTISGTVPTAANGYAFVGFYTEPLGKGVKLINEDKSWVASVEDYTDGSKKWIHDGDVTLYAYYKNAEITAFTYSTGSSTVEPNTSITVTATVEPTPVGNTHIDWRLLHGNGNEVDPQPSLGTGRTTNSFSTPEASGQYKLEAILRTGTTAGEGTLLHTAYSTFQVAGDHDVTVEYKCGDQIIKASDVVNGKPLEWTEITAPAIVGYSFSKWKAGDGITIEGADGQGEKSTAKINFKAIYDGKLTAIYTAKRMIYFNNTVDWGSVYVYFYSNDTYWSNTNGTGANGGSYKGYGQMTQIEGTNIWYYDLDAHNIPSSYTTVNFTELNQNGYNYFAKTGTVKNNVAHPCDNAATFNSGLPMYVPIDDGGQSMNSNLAIYYFKGYWMHYPNYSGYTLKIYSSKNRGDDEWGTTYDKDEIKSFDIPHSTDFTMPISVDVDLEANTKYYFDVYRNDYTYFGNNGDMKSGNSSSWSFFNTDTRRAGLQTTAAGTYNFRWTFYNGSDGYNYYMTVTYPVAQNDYRVWYSDNATWSNGAHTKNTWYHPSGVITKNTDASVTKYDTVSFFIAKDNSPAMKFQYASAINANTGKVTWSNVTSGSITIPDTITVSGVYNFIVKQVGTAKPEIEKVEKYTGNYYIRTDCANSRWDNYDTDPDHLITYSEYSVTHGGYSHYYTHWVKYTDVGRKNVKFCIANDYSPCISDTLARETASGDWTNITHYIGDGGDLIARDANVRFMWNQSTNKVSRAYVDGAQEDGSRFLIISSEDGKIKKSDGSALTNQEVTFTDTENWIYEANVKAQPGAQFKLISTWGTTNVITQYFKGSSTTTETLIDGSASTWYTIRLLYDFKTNRLVASWVPSDTTIAGTNAINADVMFIRDHQGDIAQLTFGQNGNISAIKTAYGVLRLNKWTLNNRDRSTHDLLSEPKSTYERSLYFISFPFRVKLSEVFGFGSYMTHWAMQKYDGADRAARGHFQENGSFWKWMNRTTEYLEPNQGYLLAVDLDLLGQNSDVWGPESRSEQIELYFPSYGTMPNITNASVTQELPAHTCTINWYESGKVPGPDTKDPRTSYNRTVYDSHWNVMSVPTYVNTDQVSFANTTWTTAGDGKVGPKFLYTWNSDDNTITATTASTYNYHAMHAYMVQYCGNVTWSANSGSPASVIARRAYLDKPQEVEFCLEVQQNDKMVDRTYINLSEDEEVSAGFKFGEDMTKEFNSRNANIYTFVEDMKVAGNTMPIDFEKTTIVPFGVDIQTAGEFTFSIPNGTEGVGLTLIDNVRGMRTNLALSDYMVELEAGTYDDRFVLEISPIQQIVTNIEEVTGEELQNDGIRKVMVDGVLYIIKDGKVFNAQGARIQ